MSTISPTITPFEFESRPEPLTGRLEFVDGAENILPAGFLADITACLTFDEPTLTPINARGRTYFLATPSDIGLYDALQISGGGHVDNGVRSMRDSPGFVFPSIISNEIKPPKRDFEPFESAGTSFVDDNGELKTDFPIGVFGTYLGRQAETKVRKTHEVWSALAGQDDELIVPRVIGRFVYDLPDGEGSSQTAVLMLVPNSGLRFDHLLVESDKQFLAQHFDNQEILPMIQKQYREELPEIIRALGYGIAKIHDLGYSHNQTHVGNLGTVTKQDGNQLPFIADWDTSRKPLDAHRLFAQTGDFAQAIKSQIMRVSGLFSITGIRPSGVWGPVKSIANNMLRGYASYYNHPDPDDLRFNAPLMMEQVTGIHGPQEMIRFFHNALVEARGKQ